MEKLKWYTEKRKVSTLKLYPNNPRKMSKLQAEQLMTSLKKFNYVEIIVLDGSKVNKVIAGNMRIQALKKLGRGSEEIEVRVPNRELTEGEAKEYLLRSNKNTGEFDYDLLADFDEDLLKDVGFDIAAFDFSGQDLKSSSETCDKRIKEYGVISGFAGLIIKMGIKKIDDKVEDKFKKIKEYIESNYPRFQVEYFGEYEGNK